MAGATPVLSRVDEVSPAATARRTPAATHAGDGRDMLARATATESLVVVAAAVETAAACPASAYRVASVEHASAAAAAAGTPRASSSANAKRFAHRRQKFPSGATGKSPPKARAAPALPAGSPSSAGGETAAEKRRSDAATTDAESTLSPSLAAASAASSAASANARRNASLPYGCLPAKLRTTSPGMFASDPPGALAPVAAMSAHASGATSRIATAAAASAGKCTVNVAEAVGHDSAARIRRIADAYGPEPAVASDASRRAANAPAGERRRCVAPKAEADAEAASNDGSSRDRSPVTPGGRLFLSSAAAFAAAAAAFLVSPCLVSP